MKFYLGIYWPFLDSFRRLLAIFCGGFFIFFHLKLTGINLVNVATPAQIFVYFYFTVSGAGAGGGAGGGEEAARSGVRRQEEAGRGAERHGGPAGSHQQGAWRGAKAAPQNPGPSPPPIRSVYPLICVRRREIRELVWLCLLASQGQVKDLQREVDDSRAAQKEVLSSAREAERRSKMMEAEILQLHEVRPPRRL